MTDYTKLIKALRRCSYMSLADELNEEYCKPCAYYTGHNADVTCIDRMMIDAADALEAAEKRIAEQQKQIAELYILLNNRINEIAELEAQIAENKSSEKACRDCYCRKRNYNIETKECFKPREKENDDEQIH